MTGTRVGQDASAVAEVAAAVRRGIGVLCVAGAGFLLAMDLASGVVIGYYLVFTAVVAAGGAVLLGAGWLRLPTRWAAGAAAGAALVGTPAGLLATREAAGGMWAFSQHRGYPFQWWHRGAVFDFPAEPARVRAAIAADAGTIQWSTLLADAVFWGYAGLLIVAVVVLLRRTRAARRARAGQRERADSRP